jgi:STE24 endopeptidase
LRYRLDLKYDLSVQTPKSFLRDLIKGTGLRLGFWIGAFSWICISYWLTREHWWMLCGFISAVSWAFYLCVFPSTVLPLFFKLDPLDKAIEERICSLAARAGVRLRNVYKINLSAKSRRSNLAVAGLGTRRTLLITDTVIESCSAPELEALVAHELGHIKHRHMEKRVMCLMLLSVCSCWAASQILELMRVSIGQPGSFSSACLAMTFPLVVGLFLIMKLWRKNELTADDFAFRLIGDTGPFVSGLSRLSDRNLVLVTKHNQHSFAHPATDERIRRAKAFNAGAASLS